MKKIFLLLIFGLTLTSCNSKNEKSEFDIIGNWKGEDQQEIGYFTFNSDGFVIIEMEDGIIGGKRFEKKGIPFSLHYKVEYKTEPKQIDLVFTNLDKGNQMTWNCIFEIINEDKIKFTRGTNNAPRPIDFKSSETIILNRPK
ncbi:hypothetical protein [Winogradskyella sp. R77965]|uniref:hypothetical protein n=1 Tax=Winogradskyella sp. R77965 TaxID=3093872 RepID=UPI0037DCC1CD